MDFGLGLVLSFTDNATAGINSAVNSLNQLTQVAENAGNSLNEFCFIVGFFQYRNVSRQLHDLYGN